MSVLTTITPVWRRQHVLRLWLQNLRGVTIPQVHHFVYFVGEQPPDWWEIEAPPNVTAMVRTEEPGLSIGFYHNLGASQATSEWIMKMDVDVFPNVQYFQELLYVLSTATPKEWFNGGMFYVNKTYSIELMSTFPLSEKVYSHVMDNRRIYTDSSYLSPAATNFICRRQSYLDLGGCDDQFVGYGWEDYQQLYMLEKRQLGKDPLPGPLTLANVTNRCRDEISRPKAKDLWERNSWLCLLHHWHQRAERNADRVSRNRRILFDYIMTQRHSS